MGGCDLCGLPATDPPVTDDAGGTFCCPGCRAVSQRFDPAEQEDVEVPPDAGTIRSTIGLDPGGERADPGTDPTVDSGDDSVAYLRVDGMHCGTCEAFLETRAAGIDGVTRADASYPADLVRVQYDSAQVREDDIPKRLSGFGYRARPVTEGDTDPDSPPMRLLVGGFVGMMVMMWYVIFLYPTYAGVVPTGEAAWRQTGTVSLVNIWIATTAVLAVTGYPILRGAYVSLRSGVPNMDLLVSVAIVGAYTYSAVAALLGNVEVYFDVVVVIILAVTIGRYYEDRIKRRAKGRLAAIARSRVSRATLATGTGPGSETVSVDALAPGDEVRVRPGERVPVDGTIMAGSAAIDESVVTGESVPVERGPGDRVIGGAVVTDAPVIVQVDDPDDRTIDRILGRLWDLQSTRRGAGRLADRLAALFVPLVLLLAVGGVLAHLSLGSSVESALLAGLAVLVVACPCALGLATPLAVAAGTRSALAAGVIIRNPAVFEVAPAVEVLAIDKTGTLTSGEMRVVEPPTDDLALERAAAVEELSAHPIAEAITAEVETVTRSASAFERHPGRGAEAVVEGTRVLVGSDGLFAAEDWSVPEDLAARTEAARDRGNVPVIVGWEGAAREVIEVGDRPRPGWEETLGALGEDRTVAVLTGDDERAAAAVRDHPAVDHLIAGLPPEGKAEAVARLRSSGDVAMVGDGTNDAPAMATADLGVAIGTGAALTADAADLVLTDDGLSALSRALSMASTTRRRIRENLAWAFAYNAVAIPAALLGVLDPLIAAGAMAASSLLVVSNSARPINSRVDREDDDAERNYPAGSTTDGVSSAT